MFCSKCGNIMADGTKYCPSCGARQDDRTVVNDATPNYTTHYEAPQYDRTHYACELDDCTQVNFHCKHSDIGPVNFPEAIKRFFAHYGDFQGRATRSEYWWVMLALSLTSQILAAVSGSLLGIWVMVVMIPGLALTVRRLHDVDKPGTHCLWGLAPILGLFAFFIPVALDATEATIMIALIIWMVISLVGIVALLIPLVRDSAPANRWGPNPKGY